MPSAPGSTIGPYDNRIEHRFGKGSPLNECPRFVISWQAIRWSCMCSNVPWCAATSPSGDLSSHQTKVVNFHGHSTDGPSDASKSSHVQVVKRISNTRRFAALERTGGHEDGADIDTARRRARVADGEAGNVAGVVGVRLDGVAESLEALATEADGLVKGSTGVEATVSTEKEAIEEGGRVINVFDDIPYEFQWKALHCASCALVVLPLASDKDQFA
ncbi:hypothetical protein PTI98_007247 [Pleurotus ostreatus]|nr:hypothetical protein PTI98_007247 [Pleurotus ostreatus]